MPFGGVCIRVFDVFIADDLSSSRIKSSKTRLCMLDIWKGYDEGHFDYVIKRIGLGEKWIGWFCNSFTSF